MRLVFRLALAFVIASIFVSVALAIEGNVVYKREGKESGLPPAIFPHWTHRSRYKCYACHPDIFEMKAGTSRITMDDITAGRFCGACHNGKTAWAVTFETCNLCHVEE